jgi:hypothetical protein
VTYLSNTSRAIFCIILASGIQTSADAGRKIHLNTTTVVHRSQQDLVEASATRVLMEEVTKRTGLQWTASTTVPTSGPVVIITIIDGQNSFSQKPPALPEDNAAAMKPEGFRIVVSGDQPTVRIIGTDGPGTLYGVGKFLRMLDWGNDQAKFPAAVDLLTAPQYSIRGHQLGYRNTANSYDAWDVAQYEQYIRELSFFGCNAIENIPMSPRIPLMPVSPETMHRAMGDICKRYGMQYWIWMPATVDLEDSEARVELLDAFEDMFRGCDHLTGVFVPGGDPGDHIPKLMFPFLKDAAERLNKHHSNARMWMSMQGFSTRKAKAIYKLLREDNPDWLGGIVAGPSSRPIPELRRNVPEHYSIRLYPDLTHNKICQYPVPWWDMAYANTLGREAINPRPIQYAQIHNWFAPYTDGFVSYSDGAHDDLNKSVWSALGWNSQADVRDIVTDYARVFFTPDAADGIFALERNWRGVLRYNAGVEGTLTHWRELEIRAPHLATSGGGR